MQFFKQFVLSLPIGLLLVLKAATAYCNHTVASHLVLNTETANSLYTDSSDTETPQYVDLFTSGNYLMLKGQLNSKPAYFLIDTGASFTVLHNKLA